MSAIVASVLATNLSHGQSLCGQDPTAAECELVLPPVCSRDPASSTAPSGVCDVTAMHGPLGGKRVEISLKATTATINVGGYAVSTENYNASYLSPVVEALPGDTVAAKLQNTLDARQPSGSQAGGHAHNAADNPTNLHFFHGGIVTPRNARVPNDPSDQAAKLGNGDNVYTYFKRGGAPFTYEVPIPYRLDARVIDGTGGVIPHPSGLNWYHSHLHGYSSDQVMGGLSGLLSIGDAKANLVACKPDLADPAKCNDDPNGTVALKARTDVRYALLRDISLKGISALPEAITTAPKTASWAPELKDWQRQHGDCKVWRSAQDPGDPNAKLRKGYCQQAQDKAWLFTVNGQRFPTIKVEGGKNLLLRLGNLSSNVVYWLELYNEQNDSEKEKLLLLGIDGVVPAKPVLADPNRQPVRATAVEDLVFMPASRAEILIRNDCLRPRATTYVLRTKGVVAGRFSNGNADRWPEIQLMRIELAPSTVSCTEDIALNAVAERHEFAATGQRRDDRRAVTKPEGCVDDIDPAKAEHRKVTFADGDETPDGRQTWAIKTEIVRPPDGTTSPVPYNQFKSDPAKTVGLKQPDGSFSAIPFENYDLGDGTIDWKNKDASGKEANRPHVCIFVDPDDPAQKNGLQQLWVLKNETGELHNFHIHQMKFRLATADELATRFRIKLNGPPPEPSEICADPPACARPGPVYKLYDTRPSDESSRWQDTIPMPPGQKVYVIMSFVAGEQIGRYVFHCHILKHEDAGLMAPIEVWMPTQRPVIQ
jgi:FtsP/CotA-like multicopper oxidase with cupredoxin domain